MENIPGNQIIHNNYFCLFTIHDDEEVNAGSQVKQITVTSLW